jgi:hypothetical protein
MPVSRARRRSRSWLRRGANVGAEEGAKGFSEVGANASVALDPDPVEERLVHLAAKDRVGAEVGRVGILEELKARDEVGLARVVLTSVPTSLSLIWPRDIRILSCSLLSRSRGIASA